MRELLRKNISLYDLLVKIRRYKNNAAYKRVLNAVSAIDSIRDFDLFADSVGCLVRREVPVEYSAYGGEAYYYGYYDEFLNYAGIKKPRVPIFPRMEHGVRFGQASWPVDANSLAYACQGRNRMDEIWREDPLKPVFALGPYIHYAREYYDEETFLTLKEKLGKVLLVFTSHTAEESGSDINEDPFIDMIYRKYAPNFDSVLVCAYWRDAKNATIDAFRKRGAKIVSAGFRGDVNFIRRLKTIIRLSDAVVGDALGTNIGFCLHMKRPYYLERAEAIRSKDAYYLQNVEKFYQAFETDTLEFTPQQLQLQQSLYEDFWGGDQGVYSKAEAKRLVNLVTGLYKDAHYRIDKVSAAIINKLKTLPESELEYRLLQKAVDISSD